MHVCGKGGPEVTATVLLSSLLERPHPDVPLVNPAIFSRSADVVQFFIVTTSKLPMRMKKIL